MAAAAAPEIEFPPKKTNTGEVRNAASAGIFMNGYRLRIDGTVPGVYKFELKFIAKYTGDREREMTRGPKNDVSNENRRKMLWELFQMLIASDDSFFGNDRERKAMYTYDCGINFYSIRKLMQQQEERVFPINLDALSEVSKSYMGRRVQSIDAHLLATESIDLLDKTAIEAGKDRSVIQFLEILSSQHMINEGKHHIFPQKMYEIGSAQSLQRDPRVLKSGMQKNVRFVGDGPNDAEPVLQIDPKKAAFFPPGPLGRFLEDILPGQGALNQKIFNDKNFRMAVKQVKNLSVRTNHLDVNRTFAINGLTKDGANRVEFEFEGSPVNVADYFSRKYNINLRFPNLPCVIDRRIARVDGQSKKVENFFPIEVLEIVDGQRVSIQKQTPALTEQMIRQCQALPRDFKNLNEEQRAKAFIAAANPYFKAHGIRPDTEMQKAQAELLFPPALVYANNDREEPNGANLNWKLGPQRKFLIAAQPPKIWAAVIFQHGVQGNRCQEFIQRLIQSANNRGFPITQPMRYDEWDDTSVEFLRERMKFYRDNNCMYVLFFTREKLDPVHHTMKFLETEFAITTQHISSQTMEKGIGQKGAFLVLDNVLLKMHLKLGGVNHGLSTARSMQQANAGLRHDVVAQEWIAPQRMFIGIDLSHAGPQSLYERQAGQAVTDPTVVGYAYTCGESVKIRGTYWLQEPRLTIVQDLTKHVVESIEHFGRETGKPPQSLVVYRSGVSEGEYKKVITDELNQFQKAFEQLASAHPSFRPPPITIIVAQSQSNYRVVPQQINPNGRPFEQNVPAGTVIDKTIMHPSLTDYLMIGHKTIQGTARPCRYTVLVDQHDMSLAQLEYVTYHLCYTHGIVCSPVSVPGPLYAAGDLAKRGRNNWSQYNQDDSESVVSGDSGGGRFRHDGSETFFQQRSQELKPKIHTKFWA